MSSPRPATGGRSDIALVVAVMGVLAVLFAPIPAGLLDFLILANVGFAFLLLLLTFYVPRPVDFSTFPSLLLVATLFRLALNVAATRLILTSGDAGRVISAIGSYVVGGNYVIGLIVFLILIVVQYVVVTNGAQRVSEVAARFTLDSMPGQQMSIDADLNMGFIDQEEAQRRRRNLEREAGFYGSMDGASKFVKGDAIAGIVILLINIFGGLAIGMMQRGMRWDQALETYTLLTIGDGIVTQVPALVIAVGTGIIVTRSSADTNLSREVVRQLTSAPRTLVLVAAALAGLVLLPGIPVVPALTIAAAAGVTAWFVYRRPAESESKTSNGAPDTQASTEDPYAALSIEPIEVHVGKEWAPLVGDADSVFMERVGAFRTQQAEELGIVLPRVRFKESARLGPQRYEILIDGTVTGRGEARLDRLLAIHPAGDQRAVEGEATREPTYGLPALWIDPALREEAIAARYTLVDPATVLITHLTEVLRREASTLLTRAETDRLLARVRKSQPGLVEEIVPTVLSVSDIQKVLQGLLREKISIRNIDAVMETLADAGRGTRDAGLLVEAVRQRLGHAICQSLVGEAGALHVLTLDPSLEGRLLGSLRGGPDRPPAPIDPGVADQLVAALTRQAERMMKSNLLPVLLCSPELRRHVRSLSERAMPHLRVLSMNEVPQTIELRSWGVVAA
jgi:flagellar biosynthesis protein FlhA